MAKDNKVEVRFKAFSIRNSDVSYVADNGRLRGCVKGNPILIFGNSVWGSEFNLSNVFYKIIKEDGVHSLYEKRKGSFSILCTQEKAKELKERFLKESSNG